MAVLVTVGTTDFDKLIDTMCSEDIIEVSNFLLSVIRLSLSLESDTRFSRKKDFRLCFFNTGEESRSLRISLSTGFLYLHLDCGQDSHPRLKQLVLLLGTQVY